MAEIAVQDRVPSRRLVLGRNLAPGGHHEVLAGVEGGSAIAGDEVRSASSPGVSGEPEAVTAMSSPEAEAQVRVRLAVNRRAMRMVLKGPQRAVRILHGLLRRHSPESISACRPRPSLVDGRHDRRVVHRVGNPTLLLLRLLLAGGEQ